MPKKRDDRTDNAGKLQEQVVHTIENLHESRKTLTMDLPEHQKEQIKEKNERRKKAIAGKRKEIKDEA